MCCGCTVVAHPLGMRSEYIQENMEFEKPPVVRLYLRVGYALDSCIC